MEVTSTALPSPGSTANGVAFPTIEPERVVEHLAAICQVALGATQDDLEQVGSLLHQARYSETISRCTRFANDSQNVLYIQKDISNPSAIEPGSDPAGSLILKVLHSSTISR